MNKAQLVILKESKPNNLNEPERPHEDMTARPLCQQWEYQFTGM